MRRILSALLYVLTAKMNGSFRSDEEYEADIVSDVMMPEMDGKDLCRVVKGNLDTSHIPIILLTKNNFWKTKY